MDELLKDTKTMLDLSNDKQDALLKLIIKNTTASLKIKLNLGKDDNIPEALSYIALEVSVIRFNRVNNEGMTSYSQEGESITYKASDFDDFMSDINEYKAQQNNSFNSYGTIKAISPYGRINHEI